jgi:hypothetical protein
MDVQWVLSITPPRWHLTRDCDHCQAIKGVQSRRRTVLQMETGGLFSALHQCKLSWNTNLRGLQFSPLLKQMLTWVRWLLRPLHLLSKRLEGGSIIEWLLCKSESLSANPSPTRERERKKNGKKILQANGTWKQAGVAKLISDKAEKPKLARRNKESYFILIKGTIQKEGMILIIYAPNSVYPIS